MRLGVVSSLREMEGVGFNRGRVLVAVKWVVSLLVSVAQVIANREYRAVIGLVVAMLLLALKATYNGVFWRAVGTQVIRPGG